MEAEKAKWEQRLVEMQQRYHKTESENIEKQNKLRAEIHQLKQQVEYLTIILVPSIT